MGTGHAPTGTRSGGFQVAMPGHALNTLPSSTPRRPWLMDTARPHSPFPIAQVLPAPQARAQLATPVGTASLASRLLCPPPPLLPPVHWHTEDLEPRGWTQCPGAQPGGQRVRMTGAGVGGPPRAREAVGSSRHYGTFVPATAPGAHLGQCPVSQTEGEAGGAEAGGWRLEGQGKAPFVPTRHVRLWPCEWTGQR